MIRIIEENDNKLIIKQYPLEQWLVWTFLALLNVLIFYHCFFQSPVFSSLTCSKSFLNTTNCQLIESAILNKNLTNKYINNIKKTHKSLSGRSNVIWLKTEIQLWHGQIKNIYYPSSSFIDPFLYRTNKQVISEINQINNFVHNGHNLQNLIITRKVPTGFFLIVWILLIPLFLPLFFLLVFPITTYGFDSHISRLSIDKTTLFTTNQEIYLLEQLKVLFKIEKLESSIILEITPEKKYTLNNFINEAEMKHILVSLKKFIPFVAEAK